MDRVKPLPAHAGFGAAMLDPFSLLIMGGFVAVSFAFRNRRIVHVETRQDYWDRF